MTLVERKSERSVLLTVLVVLLAGAALAVTAAAANAAPLAFTANFKGDSVSVINTATNSLVGTPIPVGAGPYSVALTPDGRRAFVVDAEDDTVSVIDTTTFKVLGEPIKVGEGPTTVAISPDGRTAYVSDETSGEVTSIDTQSDLVLTSAKGLGEAAGVAVAPDGKSVWVTDTKGNVVRVLDSQTLKPIGATIPVGKEPIVVNFTPDGRLAYVSDFDSDEVSVIDTATHTVTGAIKTGAGSGPWGLAVSPDGRKLFVSNSGADEVDVVETATDKIVGEIPVGSEPYELGMSPDGKIVYLAELGAEAVLAIDTATDKVVGAPIGIAGGQPWQVVVAPDQSPSAAFTAPGASVAIPATFDGSASRDTDGTVTGWEWLFGDGAVASGRSVTHAFGSAGTFGVQLSVVDDEGCGGAQVFTGRTALCSGGASPVSHPVTVTAPPVVAQPPPAPSNKLTFGRLRHDRGNGTVRLQVRLPAAGALVLAGPKIHQVRKKVGAPASLWVTIHARVKLNKKLKQTLRAKVRFRATFSPTGGVPATKADSVVLQRAPKKKN